MSRVGPGSRGSVVLVLLGLLLLAIVQVSLVDFLPTRWAVPDLVVVAVLALGIAHGPLVGGLVGAWAGLILDLIPPAAGPLGGWMLVLALVGAALGHVADTYRPGPVAAMLLLAVAMGAVVLGRAAVLWLAGASVGLPAVGAAAAAGLWALLLAPLALLIATPSGRAADPAPIRGVTPGAGAAGGQGSQP